MKRKDKEPRVKKEEDEKVEAEKPKKEFKIEIVKAGNLEETVWGQPGEIMIRSCNI